MITAIPAVSQIGTLSALPNLGRISYLNQGADSSFSIPGVILNLGTVTSVPLTYNSAGLFESLSQAVGSNTTSAASGLVSTTTASVFDAMNLLQGVSSDSSGQALNNLLSTNIVRDAAAPDATGKSLLMQLAADMSQAIASVGSSGTTATTSAISSDNTGIAKVVAPTATFDAAPAAVATTVPATGTTAASVEAAPVIPEANTATTSVPIATAAAPIHGVTAEASSAFASHFLEDAFARAMSEIASNPAYAHTAASLYMNLGIYRSQHGADVAQPNPTRSIQSVKALRAINPV